MSNFARFVYFAPLRPQTTPSPYTPIAYGPPTFPPKEQITMHNINNFQETISVNISALDALAKYSWWNHAIHRELRYESTFSEFLLLLSKRWASMDFVVRCFALKMAMLLRKGGMSILLRIQLTVSIQKLFLQKYSAKKILHRCLTGP